MNIEDRLERELASRAASVSAAGDLDDVRHRAVRRARTQTGLRVGVVALLIAGAGAAGFGLGRGQASEDTTSDIAASPTTEAPASTEAPPALDDDAADGEPGAVPVPSTAPPAGPAPNDEWTEDGAGDAATRSAGMLHYGWGYGYGEAATLLAERATASGATVRVSRYAWTGYEEEIYNPSSSWRPAPWCSPSGELRVALSAPGVIDVAHASWFDQPYRDLAVYTFALGLGDGSPWQVLVVQPPAGVSSVTATFPDGASDQAQVTNGVAVLAFPGDRDPTAAVLDLPGVADPAASQVGVNDLLGRVDDDYYASCNPPPPALPPAGEQQPEDPTAAEALLRDTLAALFATSQDVGQRLQFVDDPTGLADAFEQVATGPFADVAGTAVHSVQEVVFTSPTEAWFRYSIDTSITSFANRYGRATLIDGQWKITRQTVCQDLSLASASCSPDAGGTIMPPGSEHWYDQFYGDVLEGGGVDTPARTIDD